MQAEEHMSHWLPTVAVGVSLVTGALVMRSYLKANSGLKSIVPLVPLNQQSLLEPGLENARVSRLTTKASVKEDKYLRYLYEDCRTAYDAFRRGAKVSNNGQCLGWRENRSQCYQWIHYEEALRRARSFGCGLSYLGLKPGAFVGIFAQNCPEWILCEQGLFCYSMVIVPLYDTMGAHACSFIISQSDMSIVICDVDARVNLLLNEAPSCLTTIIQIRNANPETVERAKNKGIKLLQFSQIEKLGSAHLNEFPEKPPLPDDLCTISYTSGTAGVHKGVMLSHENVISEVSSALFILGEYKVTKSDVMISFLPLAHMFEHATQIGLYMEGASVGFYGGEIMNLMDDMKALQPTITLMVPRLLNRIHDAVKAKVSGSFIKRTLLQLAMNRKSAQLQKNLVGKDTIWDTLVFGKVQAGMGGRLRLFFVGSASVSESAMNFARCALGCVVISGYGLTECVTAATMTMIGDHRNDHVGPPVPCSSIKLADLPELECYAKEGRGEICVKGANVFKGYFKDPERTRETIDEDGWFHTGDVGSWLPNGTLKVIDRKQHIVKLNHGDYIATDRIENIYIKSCQIVQIYVHAEPHKYLVAVVVPTEENLASWARNNNLDESVSGSAEEMCKDSRLKENILEHLIKLGRDNGLQSSEQIKDIYLQAEPFSVENGLLTPTLKAKRPLIKKYFESQLKHMYSKFN